MNLEPLFQTRPDRPLQAGRPISRKGKIQRVVGTLLSGYVPRAMIGSLCRIHPADGRDSILAEVVGFQNQQTFLMAFGSVRGIAPGSIIEVLNFRTTLPVCDAMLGRVVNGLGDPIDGGPPLTATDEVFLYEQPANPLSRGMIDEPVDVGIRSVNALLSIGRGQRLCIMAGSGVGKSVLLGSMARFAKADVKVVALIGERGREVKEFVHRFMSEDNPNTIVVSATSDDPPLLRMRAAFVATAISEYFSQRGKNVLLLMDSLTRFAMAQREIGLAVGEPPTTKGYTPSIFSILPSLVERAGTWQGRGSITALYSVLVEGDDLQDPIGDSVRSLVDGHIVLSRELASRNQYPAIDILGSLSRNMVEIVSEDHQNAAGTFRDLLAEYRKVEDLVRIGAYKKGADPKADRSVKMIGALQDFLRQKPHEYRSFDESNATLQALVSEGQG